VEFTVLVVGRDTGAQLAGIFDLTGIHAGIEAWGSRIAQFQ
jgi:hypothetical protein